MTLQDDAKKMDDILFVASLPPYASRFILTCMALSSASVVGLRLVYSVKSMKDSMSDRASSMRPRLVRLTKMRSFGLACCTFVSFPFPG